MMQFFLKDEAATLCLGEALSKAIDSISVLYLNGDLGSGKTTFVRGLLAGMGHRGFVKSPTFTIVEPYTETRKPVYHFDLYRLDDPESLEYMGVRDYLDPRHLCIFEWPALGGDYIPLPDISIHFSFEGNGRIAQCVPGSEQGLKACEYLQKHM